MGSSDSLKGDEGGGHLFGSEQKPTEAAISTDKWNSYHSLPPRGGSYPCNSPLMFGRRDRGTAMHVLKAGEGYTSPSYFNLLL